MRGMSRNSHTCSNTVCQVETSVQMQPWPPLASTLHASLLCAEVNQDARFFHAWCPQHHPDWVRSPAGVLAHHPAVIRFARPHHSVLAPKSNGNTRAQSAPRPANGVKGVLIWGRDISFWVEQVSQSQANVHKHAPNVATYLLHIQPFAFKPLDKTCLKSGQYLLWLMHGIHNEQYTQESRLQSRRCHTRVQLQLWPPLASTLRASLLCAEVNQDARFFHAWCPQHHPDWVRSPAGVLAHHPAVIRFARPHHSVLAPKSNGNTRAQCAPHPANGVKGVLIWGRDISFWVEQVSQSQANVHKHAPNVATYLLHIQPFAFKPLDKTCLKSGQYLLWLMHGIHNEQYTQESRLQSRRCHTRVQLQLWPPLASTLRASLLCAEVNQDARFFYAWCPQHHPDWVRSPAGVLAHHPAVIRFARPHHSVLAPKSNGNTRAQCAPRPANGVKGVLIWGRNISLWVGQAIFASCPNF